MGIRYKGLGNHNLKIRSTLRWNETEWWGRGGSSQNLDILYIISYCCYLYGFGGISMKIIPYGRKIANSEFAFMNILHFQIHVEYINHFSTCEGYISCVSRHPHVRHAFTVIGINEWKASVPPEYTRLEVILLSKKDVIFIGTEMRRYSWRLSQCFLCVEYIDLYPLTGYMGTMYIPVYKFST